ncbi:blue-sensitive opsin-like isoform X2 [Sinocyclocheilus anshuiensis]|uniref:blue-sensitive opsin-like isoform X2 n=1 Tax=Sinocyclocheilus anshuiensis TaxID=1608454 RepID=UPI0007B8D05D|nr:PREDICTED: blue-sensitive opsin-like isoform X2 [Sinocyclocheilus anshuiensis]
MIAQVHPNPLRSIHSHACLEAAMFLTMYSRACSHPSQIWRNYHVPLQSSLQQWYSEALNTNFFLPMIHQKVSNWFKLYFIFGPTACKIEGFLATLGGMVSLWSLAVVAFERWLVICKPLGNFTFKTPHAIAGCILPWISASAASLPPLFGWSRYIPEGLQCSCGPDWYTTNNNESYVMFLFCFCFAVPFGTIMFCYGQLLITLKLAAKAQADSASTQKAEREVTKMVVVMVFGFLLCWAPYASFSLWIVSHRGETFGLRMATIPSCLSKASTVYNPVIYVLMNKQFRSCMMKMVCGKNIEEDEASTSSQVTQVSSVAPEK